VTAVDKLTKARTALVLDFPFYGSLALRLRLVADPGVDTAATDGKSVRFNPGFIDGLTAPEVRGLLAHEVLHCAHGHQWRRDGRDLKRWNVSADYAINAILAESGFQLPAGALRAPRFDGQSAEQIYGAMAVDPQAGQAGEPGPSGLPGPSEDTGAGQASDGADGTGAPQPGGAPDPGRCGAIVDGDSADADCPSEADWQVATVQAAKSARAAGDLPGAIARLVDKLTDRSLDWRVVLADFVQRCARNDYDWARPSRRYLQSGFALPSLRSDELPCVVLAVDTSGSIDKPALSRFCAALSDALGAYPTTAHVVCCDTAIQSTAEYSTADLPIDVDPRGGGGTSFRPVFDWIDRQGIEPAALVYFTDLECSEYPDAEPDYPVLWVTPEPARRSAPWGEVLTMG